MLDGEFSQQQRLDIAAPSQMVEYLNDQTRKYLNEITSIGTYIAVEIGICILIDNKQTAAGTSLAVPSGLTEKRYPDDPISNSRTVSGLVSHRYKKRLSFIGALPPCCRASLDCLARPGSIT